MANLNIDFAHNIIVNEKVYKGPIYENKNYAINADNGVGLEKINESILERAQVKKVHIQEINIRLGNDANKNDWGFIVIAPVFGYGTNNDPILER